MADFISSSTQPAPYVMPYAANYLDAAHQLMQQPYQPFQGPKVASMDPYTTQGLTAQAQRATQGSPVMGAANTELQGTIEGQHLSPGSNPYLQQNVQAAQDSIVKNFNMTTAPAQIRSMVNSGSFGNSGLEQFQLQDANQLQQNLGKTASSMYGANYDAERGRQMQALSMAPTFANQDYTDATKLQQAGQGFQDQQQKQNDWGYQQYLDAMNYPKDRLAIMGGALGIGGQGTSTVSPGTSSGASALGGALTGAQIISLLTGGKGLIGG